MSLSEISRATNLNKATLHEHLSKLCEADLVKRKDREGINGCIINFHGKEKAFFILKIPK